MAVRKPFYRAFDDWWYVQVRIGTKRKQIKLVKGADREDDAWKAFHRVMAQETVEVPQPTTLHVATLCL